MKRGKFTIMEKLFHLQDRNTTVKAELIGGITTFMAMSYILSVNPGMFTALGNVSFGAIYIATALSAVVGTLLIGLLANLPLAQASGMGLNAFFVFTVCFGMGFSYANALLFVLVDGILFILLTVTGLRKLIFDAIPKTVKQAIPAGIGLFIAFLGFQDSGLVIPSSSTGVTLASFNLLGSATWASIMPLLVTIATVVAIAVLSKKGFKGAIMWSILGGTAVYYLLSLTVSGFDYSFLTGSAMNPLTAFKEFGTMAFGKVFTEGFDFSGYLGMEGHSVTGLVIALMTYALAFCMVGMFDTLGRVWGACTAGNVGGRDCNLHGRGLRNFDGHHLCGILLRSCGRSKDGTFLDVYGGAVPHCIVLRSGCGTDPRLRICGGADLRRYPYDGRRARH